MAGRITAHFGFVCMYGIDDISQKLVATCTLNEHVHAYTEKLFIVYIIICVYCIDIAT